MYIITIISISDKGNIDIVAIFALGSADNARHLPGSCLDVLAHARSTVNQKSKVQIGQFFFGSAKSWKNLSNMFLIAYKM
jgi:hypothetical protein